MRRLRLQLTNAVPLDLLRKLASEHEITPPGITKESLIDALIASLGESSLERQFRDYIHAGRGAITWFVLEWPARLDLQTSIRTIQRRAVEQIGGDPFEVELRPSLGASPRLVHATRFSDTSVLLDFAYLGPLRFIEENFEIVPRQRTFRAKALLRTEPACFEIRADANKAPRIARTLAALLGYQDYAKIVLTDEELDTLIQHLDGRLRGARHKYAEGDLDTVEVWVHRSCPDMRSVPKYQTDFAPEPTRRKVFEFDFPLEGFLQTVVLHVSTVTGSFWFQTPASEPEIEHVLERVRDIKDF